jgi:hypothetical protein
LYLLPSGVRVETTFLWDVSIFHEWFDGDGGVVPLSGVFHSLVVFVFCGNSPEFGAVIVGSDLIRRSIFF